MKMSPNSDILTKKLNRSCLYLYTFIQSPQEPINSVSIQERKRAKAEAEDSIKTIIPFTVTQF